MLRCGHTDPGTAPIASSSRRNSAVRMLVSWRHDQRSQPIGPSCGWVIVGVIVSVTSDHRHEAVDEHGLDAAGDALPQTGDQEYADDDQERAPEELDAALVASEEGRHRPEALVPGGD